MATKKKTSSTEGEETQDSNLFGTTEQGPTEKPKGASEDAVLSPIGVTEPSKTFKGDGVTPSETGQVEIAPKKPSGDELYTGKFILRGKTFHGQSVEDNLIVTGPGITEQGLFRAFLNNHRDGVEDGFEFEQVEEPAPSA